MARRALTIGINYTKSPQLATLRGAVSDSLNLKMLFQQFGFTVTNMNDMYYSATSPLFPSRNNIIQQVTNILTAAQNGDTVVITYSGHGIQLLASRINIEELDKRDEAIIPTDFVIATQQNAIVDDTIHSLLVDNTANKPNTKIFLLMDCSHSGTCADLRYAFSYQFNMQRFVTIDTKIPDGISATVIMLSACKDNEISWEKYVKIGEVTNWQGFLAGAFIATIKADPTTIRNIFKLTANIVNILQLLFFQFKIKSLSSPMISSNVDLISYPSNRSIVVDMPPALRKNKPPKQLKILHKSTYL